MVGLAVVAAIGILRYVLDDYPIPVQLATGLPALAAVGTGLASFGFSAKADKFKMAGLAMGLAAFGILLLWALHQLFPSIRPS